MNYLTIDQIKTKLHKGKTPQLSVEEAICWICHRMLGSEVYMSGLVQSPPSGYQISDTICIAALHGG